jgi:3-oxoadipate enol-lactonase
MLSYIGANIELKEKKHAVFLLHAFPLSSAMWMPQIKLLARENFCAIAPDVFWVNNSKKKPDWQFSDVADELFALVEFFGFQSVSLVGVSMGGYQAFAFYKKYPHFVKSLLLAATRADADTDTARQNRFAFIDAVEKNGTEEAVTRMLPKLLGKTTHEKNSELVQQVRTMIRLQTPQAIIENLKALANRDDATPLLSGIKIPTLAVAGSEDELMTVDIMRPIHTGTAQSQFTIIDGSGHLPNLEQPEKFNALLYDHLKSSL